MHYGSQERTQLLIGDYANKFYFERDWWRSEIYAMRG